MRIPTGLRVALAVWYAIGIAAVIWLVGRPGWEQRFRSDRVLFGLLLLVLCIPFTIAGAFLMRPYIRRPEVGWWIAYHAVLMFIIVLHIGFVAAAGAESFDFFTTVFLFDFPADLLGLALPAAVFVASAPLIKRRRERRRVDSTIPGAVT